MPGVLSEAERVVFERLAIVNRRRDWLAGRVAAKRALRRAVREAGGIAPPYHAITVWNEDDGAPRFSIDEQPALARRWNISLAHTSGTAVVALADTRRWGNVGVDIERTRPLSAGLIRRALSTRELERLEDRNGHMLEPLLLWTIKEAVLKAGRGRCDALRQIELAWSGSGRVTARIVGVRESAPHIATAYRTVGPYTIALALWRADGPIAARRGSRGHRGPAPAGATAAIA